MVRCNQTLESANHTWPAPGGLPGDTSQHLVYIGVGTVVTINLGIRIPVVSCSYHYIEYSIVYGFNIRVWCMMYVVKFIVINFSEN